ncbi:MAG: ketopantoate reductase family protein, partial [Chloroflexi bacterium]|nr:ketopantoate reductase family protein [Chloroflexota bacterium]
SQGTPLLIVQNGVGGEELAQQVLRETAIISGVLTISVSVLSPGYIRLETTQGGLNLAPVQRYIDMNKWAMLFSSAGLRTALYPSYQAMKWSKLLLNILGNAIPAILDMTPGTVFACPALFAIERAAFLEARAVMGAMQLPVVSFPRYPVPLLAWAMQQVPAFLLRPLLMRLIASGRGEKRPSLHLDLASGRRRSEVLYLNGAVVTHAQRLGMDAPVNRILCDLLVSIVAGQVPWEEFRGQPQKLVKKIQDEAPGSLALYKEE